DPPRPSTRLSTLDAAEQTTVAKDRHSEPPKLFRLVRGDLDWIVMKTLEKDRNRRYETANELAMDIERFLANEPIVARSPSNLYRFQKLVRRNKLVFAAAIGVAVALVAGFGVATWQWVEKGKAYYQVLAAERRATIEAERATLYASEEARQHQ